MTKKLLFLFLIFFGFCVKTQNPELLNPEVFFYACSEKWSGKVDGPHFFGLLDQLNLIFELDLKQTLGEKDFKKKYKKHVLTKLSDRFFLQDTAYGKEVLELFLQVLSDSPTMIKHDQNCPVCRENAKFINENKLAIANLVKFISLKKTFEASKFFKWLGFFGTVVVVVAGFLVSEQFFEKKLKDSEVVKTLKDKIKKLKKDLKEKNEESDELIEKNNLLTEQNSSLREANKEFSPQIIALVGDFAKLEKETNLKLGKLDNEIQKIEKTDS